MVFRAFASLFVPLSAWSAYLQLNDPDPERWVAMYLACTVVAALDASGRSRPRLASAVAAVALIWAAFILPELVHGWRVADLTATMVASRPEIEYGREFCGLSIVAGYCLASVMVTRQKRSRSAAQSG